MFVFLTFGIFFWMENNVLTTGTGKNSENDEVGEGLLELFQVIFTGFSSLSRVNVLGAFSNRWLIGWTDCRAFVC